MAQPTARKKAPKRRRKVIQIAAIPAAETDTQICAESLFALCDDGTIWEMLEGTWRPIKDIPQDSPQDY